MSATCNSKNTQPPPVPFHTHTHTHTHTHILLKSQVEDIYLI